MQQLNSFCISEPTSYTIASLYFSSIVYEYGKIRSLQSQSLFSIPETPGNSASPAALNRTRDIPLFRPAKHVSFPYQRPGSQYHPHNGSSI